jgi:preprotein translocase subunit SecA
MAYLKTYYDYNDNEIEYDEELWSLERVLRDYNRKLKEATKAKEEESIITYYTSKRDETYQKFVTRLKILQRKEEIMDERERELKNIYNELERYGDYYC